MLSYKATLVVTEVLKRKKEFNNNFYDVYRCKAVDVSIYLFVSDKYKLSVGDILRADKAYLTNYDPIEHPIDLAIRVDTINEFLTEYTPPEYLEVKVNGRHVRGDNVHVKGVGAMRRPFIPCSLFIQNEDKKKFSVLTVGFCKVARRLEEIPSGSYIDVVARLKQKRDGSGYELNVTDFNIVENKKQ